MLRNRRIANLSYTGYKNESSERLFENYYHDELIVPQYVDENLPEPLQAVRSLEKKLSGQQLFLQQVLMLADYEDDYEYNKEVIRYYPTYQTLSNRELRAYFSWRTKWKKGNLHKTSLSFAFLYIYELLHLVGCSDAQEAYEKLKNFAYDYAIFDSKILSYLKKWLVDFVVYYELNPKLLADREEIRKDNALFILQKMQIKTETEIFQAVLELSDSVLKKSRFYKTYPEMTQSIVVGMLRQIETHFAKKCQKSWIANYFGNFFKKSVRLFENAIFCHRYNKQADVQVELSPLRSYYCIKGRWFLYSCNYENSCRKRFLNLIRTIDALMRESVNFPYPLLPKVKIKWLIETISEEIKKYQGEKQRAEKKKLNLDLSKLGSIRSSSDVTREKLLTDEEKEENFSAAKLYVSVPESDDDNVGFSSLTSQEKKYLQCLLEGSSLNWINVEGILPSLLCDSINEKLYEIFEDTILENGELIDDYKEELKKGLQL